MDDTLRSEFEKLGEEWSEAIVSNDAGSEITDVFTRRRGPLAVCFDPSYSSCIPSINADQIMQFCRVPSNFSQVD
jgi:hypothetical protein